MLLGTLEASLLCNLLSGGIGSVASRAKGEGIMRAGEGSVASRTKGDGIVRACEEIGSKKKILNLLLPFHPLTNIEISEYYKNEPRFSGVYSRNNLPKTIQKGAYVINLDEYENTATHWVALFVKTNEAIYFDSFGIKHIPIEINKFINNDTTKSSSL